MKHLPWIAAAAILALGASALPLQTASAQAPATVDATRGKAAFIANGCFQCHGTTGLGNLSAGPSIAPHPIDFKNFLAYIRNPKNDMPQYSAKILPESTALDIHAYLASIPAGKRSTDIAVLQSFDLGNAGPAPNVSPAIAHGRQLFEENCQKCHVSAPIGPSLANIKAHLDLDKTIAFIKNPAPPMTKLYPSPLSDNDVADIAAYVQTL